MQPDDRVDLDLAGLGALAHDLPVNLALGRHVDHDVAEDRSLTAQPAARGEAATGRIARLGRSDLGQVVGVRGHAELGEFARAQAHLTTAAQTAPAAHGIDVDAELARRIEDRGAERKSAAPARGCENDEPAVSHGGGGSSA